MFAHHIADLGLIPLLATAIFAWWKGDRPEHFGGSLNVLAAVFAYAVNFLLRPQDRPVALLAVDAALAIGFLALAILYTSLWLGAAMLLQAAQFSLHAYYIVTAKPHDNFYAIVNNVNTTGVQVAILVGTLSSWRRRVRGRERGARE